MKFVVGTRLAALALLFIAVDAVRAGPGDWSGQGPFGGEILLLRADPLVATRVYAFTGNGFYRSDDGGASWTYAESGLLAPHPTNGVFSVSGTVSGRLYLFDDVGRLYSSVDAGNTWIATGYLAPVAATLPQNIQNTLVEGAGNTVWFASGANGLLVSTDGGATFSAASGTGAPSGLTINSVITNPSSPQHVIAAASSGCSASTGACPFYVSANGGATWTTIANPDGVTAASQQRVAYSMSYGPASSVYVSYLDPTIGGSGKLLHSTNDGSSWSSNPLTFGFYAVTASPADANSLWIGNNVSTNAGATYSALPNTGITTNGTFIPAYGVPAAAADYATSGRLWIGTGYAGVFLSNNHGTSWTQSVDGMAATYIRTVVVHPVDNTRLFAGFGDALGDPSQAFFRSTSTGSWTASNSGLNAYQLRTILIDPTTASNVGSTVIYGVGSGYDASPHTNTDRNSGIYKSPDGGLTWATQTGGIPVTSTGIYAGSLRTIIADPRSCDGRGPTAQVCTTGPLKTLFVTGSGNYNFDHAGAHPNRVMKSVDGGVNWADSSTGLPSDQIVSGCAAQEVGGVTPIVMDPTNSQILYIGTFADAEDAGCNEISPTITSGVYKSVDGGATWNAFNTGLPTFDGTPATSVLETLSLTIDPSNPQTLWVSTKDLNISLGTPGEIYKTVDGGQHWFVSNAGINGPDVRALLADPSNPGTIYAASGGLTLPNGSPDPTDPGGVYKSTDGGANWKSISVGFPAAQATALALDPIDPTVLYAGTSGGVYSIVQLPDDDADGVPDLIENAGPNGGDANHDNSQDSGQSNVSTTAPGLFGSYGWQAGMSNASQSARTSAIQQQIKSMKSSQDGIEGGYFTVQVEGSSCTQAVDVAPISPGPLGLDNVAHHGTYTYPRGLVRFEIPRCATANVDVMFNAATFGPGWTWRYYGPSTPGDSSTLGWHDATQLVQSIVGNDWLIHLAVGSFGSYRPTSTNSILFEGGPSYNDTVFSDNLELQ